MVTLKEKLIKTNLFTKEMKLSERENAEEMASISTRIYFILLISSILVIILFNSLTITTSSFTVQSPTLTVYDDLRTRYPNSFVCQCKQIAVPYGAFLSVSVSYHQVKNVKKF